MGGRRSRIVAWIGRVGEGICGASELWMVCSVVRRRREPAERIVAGAEIA